MSNSQEPNSVQGILHDSLTSVGFEPMTLSLSDKNALMRREGSTLSVASLPATMKDGPKPFFKSKIPTPTKSGHSTPLNGSRTDLSKLRNLSSPPPIPPKPKLNQPQQAVFQKVPLRREISLPPCLNERRGSVDSTSGGRVGRNTPTNGIRTRIPQWRGSTEKLNNNSSTTGNTVKGQIRKWESSASLEVRLELFHFLHFLAIFW